jgi:hypothetical protein
MTEGTTGHQAAWPLLPPLAQWQETCATVHMWSQILGKIRLRLAPPINHWWGVAMYTTTRGLTTSPIPYGARTFTMELDFTDHLLSITTSDGLERAFGLRPMSVADFFGKTMAALMSLDIRVRIFTRPVEVAEAIPFEVDQQHAAYDAASIRAFWRALVQSERVLTRFRAGFLGKASPVHFFWGGFDLATTRFSGRTAPRHPGGVVHCADWVMVEAYSHEVSSAGFWPGTGIGEACFYSYAYPVPPGFAACPVQPAAAYFHQGLGEFVLPYAAVRAAADPDQSLLSFLQSTYEAAATTAGWDRAALERA